MNLATWNSRRSDVAVPTPHASRATLICVKHQTEMNTDRKSKLSPLLSAFFGLVAGIGVGLLVRPSMETSSPRAELVPIFPKAERFYVVEGAGDKFNPATDPLCRPPATVPAELSQAMMRFSALPASELLLPEDRGDAEKILQSVCDSRIKILDSGTWNSTGSFKNGIRPTNEPSDDARKYLVQLSQHLHEAPSSRYFLVKSFNDAILIADTNFSIFSSGDQIYRVHATPGGSKMLTSKSGTFYVGGLGNKSLIVSVEF